MKAQNSEILQLLKNQRVEPVPRAKPAQTVSLSRATGKATRVQQKPFHLFSKSSRGAFSYPLVDWVSDGKLDRCFSLERAASSHRRFFSSLPDAGFSPKPAQQPRTEAGAGNGQTLPSHNHQLDQDGSGHQQGFEMSKRWKDLDILSTSSHLKVSPTRDWSWWSWSQCARCRWGFSPEQTKAGSRDATSCSKCSLTQTWGSFSIVIITLCSLIRL